MLLESQAPQSGPVNIVLQDDGIHDSHFGGQREKVEEPPKQENKVSKDEVQRRKALMKKIKNRIVEDF